MKCSMKRTAAALLACLLAGTTAAGAVDYTKVASAADMTTVNQVGVEGMEPISASDVKDGTYEVTVESSSSMFKITKAVLTVADGTMTAALTLSGTSYLFLYPGAGTDAAADTEDHFIGYVEDAEGAYTYTIPVPALDQPFPCAAFSMNKEKWYDRTLLVRADSLPEEAVLVELPDYEALEKAARDARIEAVKGESTDPDPVPAFLDLPDGDYTVDVSMEGGTGRASVTSPASMRVEDGEATVLIEWSSPNFDYMIVGGKKYLTVNDSGNSMFEIPVTVLDSPISVTADTTAMSQPHEIEYTLTFTLTEENPLKESNPNGLVPVLACAGVLVALSLIYRKKEPRA